MSRFVGVRLPNDVAEAVARRAIDSDRTISAVVVELVTAGLTTIDTKNAAKPAHAAVSEGQKACCPFCQSDDYVLRGDVHYHKGVIDHEGVVCIDRGGAIAVVPVPDHLRGPATTYTACGADVKKPGVKAALDDLARAGAKHLAEVKPASEVSAPRLTKCPMCGDKLIRWGRMGKRCQRCKRNF